MQDPVFVEQSVEQQDFSQLDLQASLAITGIENPITSSNRVIIDFVYFFILVLLKFKTIQIKELFNTAF